MARLTCRLNKVRLELGVRITQGGNEFSLILDQCRVHQFNSAVKRRMIGPSSCLKEGMLSSETLAADHRHACEPKPRPGLVRIDAQKRLRP